MSPLDAVALTTARALILVVAVAASVIPARRAARIDPNVSLRAEYPFSSLDTRQRVDRAWKIGRFALVVQNAR